MPDGNSRAYLVGVTNIVVTISAIVEVTPGKGVLSGFLEIASAGTSGLVAVVNPGLSVVGASATANGYRIPTDRSVELEGPAKFYLAASVNSVTVSFFQRYSQGTTFV